MKKTFILIIILFSALNVIYAEGRDPELLALVKDRLKSDELPFEEFRHTGICRCLDTLEIQRTGKTIKEWDRIYRNYYSAIAVNSLFPSVIKKDTADLILDRFYSENLDLTIKRLRWYNEKFNNKWSRYKICVTMYSNTERLRSLYLSMVENDDSYYMRIFRDKGYIEKLLRLAQRRAEEKWD